MPRDHCEDALYDVGDLNCCTAWLCYLPFHLVWDPAFGLLYAVVAVPFALLFFLVPCVFAAVWCFLVDLVMLPNVLVATRWFGLELKVLLLLAQPLYSIVRLATEVIFAVLLVAFGSIAYGFLLHLESPLRPWRALGEMFCGDGEQIIRASWDYYLKFWEARNNPDFYDRVRNHPGPPIRVGLCEVLFAIPLSVCLAALVAIPTLTVTVVYTAYTTIIATLPFIFMVPLLRGKSLRDAEGLGFVACMMPFYYLLLILGSAMSLIGVVLVTLLPFLRVLFGTLAYVRTHEVFSSKPFWNAFAHSSEFYQAAVEASKFIVGLSVGEDSPDQSPSVFLFGQPNTAYRARAERNDGPDFNGPNGPMDLRDNPRDSYNGNVVVLLDLDHDPPAPLARQVTSDEPVYAEYFNGLIRLPAGRRLGVTTVWNSFFNQCYTLGCEARQTGLITKEECEDQDPFLFLGLPALVIFACLERSVELDSEGIVLATGVEITEENRPSGTVSNLVWRPSLHVKGLIKAAKLDEADKQFVRRSLLRQHNDDPDCATLPQGRIVVLNEITSKLNSLAINVSRLMKFSTRFREVLVLLIQDTGASKGDENV